MSKREAYHYATAAEMTDAETWDTLVSRVLGPVVTEADREKRRADALALAAAAMRAAAADHSTTKKVS